MRVNNRALARESGAYLTNARLFCVYCFWIHYSSTEYVCHDMLWLRANLIVESEVRAEAQDVLLMRRLLLRWCRYDQKSIRKC